MFSQLFSLKESRSGTDDVKLISLSVCVEDAADLPEIADWNCCERTSSSFSLSSCTESEVEENTVSMSDCSAIEKGEVMSPRENAIKCTSENGDWS